MFELTVQELPVLKTSLRNILFNHFIFPLAFTEMLMDSTTATAELGWTVYPVSGTSDTSVSPQCFSMLTKSISRFRKTNFVIVLTGLDNIFKIND